MRPHWKNAALSAVRAPLYLSAMAAAIAALAGCGGDEPAPVPTQNVYVAMGDSFSSGHGTVPHPDMRQCSRTPYAYSSLWAPRHRLEGYTFVACQGATTANVVDTPQTAQGETRPQVAALSAETKVVTITIGGNDVGFADIAQSCAQSEIFNKDKPACQHRIDGIRELVEGVRLMPDNTRFDEHLLRAYQAIRSRVSPDARIFVLGYPQMYYLPPKLEAIGPETRRQVDELMVAMNGVIQRTAASAGVRFVDVDAYFAGHGAGESNPNGAWINNITLQDVHASLHPNAQGHEKGFMAALEAAAGN